MSSPSGAVIGVLIDARRVLEAAALLLQLNATGTLLPRIFFCHAALPPRDESFLQSLGGQVVLLRAHMPIPANFTRLLGLRDATDDIGGRAMAWRKLGFWAHTEFAKIVALDVDVYVHSRRFEAGLFERGNRSLYNRAGGGVCTDMVASASRMSAGAAWRL